MAKTSRPMIRIHDTEKDEIIDREMNDAEFAEYQAFQSAQRAIDAAKAKAESDKVALLTRLGLTEDELKTILG